MDKNGVAGNTVMNVGNRPDGIAIHDLNGDGKNDIIVSNYDDNTIIILFKKGVISFYPTLLCPHYPAR